MQLSFSRRKALPSLLFAFALITFLYYRNSSSSRYGPAQKHAPLEAYSAQQSPAKHDKGVAFKWANVKPRYPVTSFIPLPSAGVQTLPKIQHTPRKGSPDEEIVRKSRLGAVKAEFVHAWTGYKKHAWLHDEVAPLSGGIHDTFGGWAATLVDSLDTLLIMDMKDDFEEALQALNKIDFTTCSLETLNVFETTIRYLGGFLAAYDLSDGKYPSLLEKAQELGEMLYVAFDTPNRMPITRWKFKEAIAGYPQTAHTFVLVAEIGSLTLEFTRLTQLTGEPKYYDAVQRIMDVFEAQQEKTKLPGLWPIGVNAKELDFTAGEVFTLGGMADSVFEYLPKQHMLLGGATNQYKNMYERALVAMKETMFFRPMTHDNLDILFSGQVNTDGKWPAILEAQVQHLGCFVPGMVGIAAKLFPSDSDLEIARKLVDGCIWSYEAAPLGVMPEIFHTVSCGKNPYCEWDEHLFNRMIEASHGGEQPSPQELKMPSAVKVDDKRYILRPEAIESVFIMYRITGDIRYQDHAWTMFEAIIKHTKTSIAHAALTDCMNEGQPHDDRMESFWLAETLKYFYLIFADEDVVSLDDWVLNTEAHPLKRPVLI